LQVKEASDEVKIAVMPVWLFLVGFVLMFVGVSILFVAAALQGNFDISGGGIIFVGPIPVIFGAGSHAYLAIFLAAILTIIGFIVFFLMRKTRV
jgi:uncharacterized membrane protein